MFSVTNTALKILPLWTLKVRPTKSGVIIERRDQVLIGVFDLVSLAFWILSSKWPSTNGPFLIERPILLVLHRPAIAADQNKTIGMFFLVAGAVAFGEQSPGRSTLLPAA